MNRIKGNISLHEIPLVVTAGAHAAGELIAALTEVPNACVDGLHAGHVVGAVLLDAAGQGASVDLLIANNLMPNTTFTLATALTVDDADLPDIVGIMSLTKHTAFVDNGISEPAINQRPIPYELGRSIPANIALTSLYVALIAREAATYALAGDLVLNLLIKHPDGGR